MQPATTSPSFFSSTIGSIATALTALGAFAIWLYRHLIRRAQVQVIERQRERFVEDMATNHLPHIYHSQEKLAGGINTILRQVGADEGEFVSLDAPPPIRFVPFDPTKER